MSRPTNLAQYSAPQCLEHGAFTGFMEPNTLLNGWPDRRRVTQVFDGNGNVFRDSKGIGAAPYRKLQTARLIEEVPAQKVGAAFASHHKQQLTAKGRAALSAALEGRTAT